MISKYAYACAILLNICTKKVENIKVGGKLKMNRKFINSLVLGVVISMMATGFTGCTKKTVEKPVNGTNEKVDTSKAVNLKMYLIGDAAKNEAEGLAKINEKMKAKINATLEISNIPFSAYKQKIPVLLASGEPFDMIYSSNWVFFTTEAPKGAYMGLNELLPKYAPTVKKEIPEEAWKQATVNGEISMIPAISANFNVHGVVVRDDLRKKYNLPVVNSMETWGTYMEAIKKNEPNITPYASNGGNMMNFLVQQKMDWSQTMVAGEVVYDITKGDKVFAYTSTPEYEALVKQQRDWYNKGYWSKSVLSNKTQPADTFKAGTSASYIVNTAISGIQEYVVEKKLPYELAWNRFDEGTAVERSPFIGNGTAINRKSANPERALMFFEMLHTDKGFADLVLSGVKGKNYDLTAEGKIKVPEGVNPTDAPWDNTMMGLSVAKFNRVNANRWDLIIKEEAKYDKSAISAKLAGFVPNLETLSGEIAAVTNVNTTYKNPLDWGVVDPVTALPELRKKLQEAGIDKIITELNKQITEYNAKQK